MRPVLLPVGTCVVSKWYVTHSQVSALDIPPIPQEQKTWARLLQSYVLPLVSFVASDLPSLEEALSCQAAVLAGLDTAISAAVARSTEVPFPPPSMCSTNNDESV